MNTSDYSVLAKLELDRTLGFRQKIMSPLPVGEQTVNRFAQKAVIPAKAGI